MKALLFFPRFSIAWACLLAGLVFFVAGCGKKTSTDADDKAASPSEAPRVGEASGETVVKLSEDEIQRVGLEMAVLPAATGRASQHALGVVVDLQSLFDGAAALADAQAQAAKATAALSASAGEYDRAKKLHDDGQSVSTKDLEAAAAAWQADDAASRAAQAAWQARRAALDHQWGPTLVGWLVQDAPEYQRLAKGETLLVRVARADGGHLAAPPAGAELLRPDKQWAQAQFVSPSPQATPEFQTEGFFFVVDAGGGLLPGMNVEALLAAETVPEQSGVIVPDAAVVWWQGRAWVFVQAGQGGFVQREISADQPEPDGGYFVADFPAGQTVVVRGAQILLSEETKPAAGD
jgi:hypothetical protein